jgi:iron complex outermembrane receptor protein
MKRIFFILCISLSFSLQAQEKGIVTGNILDAELHNEPLMMASVILKGTDYITQTNFNGNFEITSVSPGDYILKISFLGYEDVELPISVRQNNPLFVSHSLKAKTMHALDVAETDFTSSKKVAASGGQE